MEKQYSEAQLLAMEPVDVYKLVLDEKINRFPRSLFFYKGVLNVDAIASIVKYLFEVRLEWGHEEICNSISNEIFYENKLKFLIRNLLNNSPYKLLEIVYPGEYKPWELKNSPKGYFNRKIAIEAVKWLIEVKKKWARDEVCKNLSCEVFYQNNLRGIFHIYFDNSVYKALNAAYPDEYKPWELNKVPLRYWNRETGIEAVKWLIEEKKKWTRDEVCKNLTYQVFFENGLRSVIPLVFHGCLYEAINSAYPGEYKPWELKSVPKKYWNKTTAIEATIWLIDDKLNWTKEFVYENLKYKVFVEYGLAGMLDIVYHGNIFAALKAAYPNEYDLSEFIIKKSNSSNSKIYTQKKLLSMEALEVYKLIINNEIYRFPKGFWNFNDEKNFDNARALIRYLCDDILKLEDNEKMKMTLKDFQKNLLSGMMNSLFNNSPIEAIRCAYPELF